MVLQSTCLHHSHWGYSLYRGMQRCVFLDHKRSENTLPLHETHTIEVDTVENKEAHLGILKGSFLKRERER